MARITPENRVKNKINKVLAKYREDHIWYYMPVPGGYGKSTLDYIGIFLGLGFAIEAKAPGKAPTDRQLGTIEQIQAARGKVFVINDDVGLIELDEWLAAVAKDPVSMFALQVTTTVVAGR